MDKHFRNIHIINSKTNEELYVINNNFGAISLVENLIIIEEKTVIISELKNIKIVID